MKLNSVLLGSDLDQRFRSLATPLTASDLRVCGTCIREGYHSTVDQLAGLVRCSVHGELLGETCLQCNKPLGPYAVARHRGFRCRHCDAPFLSDDQLPMPSEICDLSKRNPNVFYEMGLAHMLGKDVIMITQSSDDVPFDVRSIRYVNYLKNAEGLRKLTTDVAGRQATLRSGAS
jgi:hypothetical protein